MSDIIGYRAKYNIPKMLAGDIVFDEWAKNHPDILIPVTEDEYIQQLISEVEMKLSTLRMFIQNKKLEK